jgi:hypothetical protein
MILNPPLNIMFLPLKKHKNIPAITVMMRQMAASIAITTISITAIATIIAHKNEREKLRVDQPKNHGYCRIFVK